MGGDEDGRMEIRKILYITNMEKTNFDDMKPLSVLRKVGLDEVIFLHTGGAEDWERRVSEYGLRAKTIAGKGPFLPRILQAVQSEGISLVVTNLRKEARKIFGGSLVVNVLRSLPVPVMVLNEDAASSAPMQRGLFHHVIFATDWSTVSEGALRYLLHLKEIIGVLEIVHVINKKLSVRELRDLKKRLVETRRIFLAEGIDAEAHVYAGKRSEEIMLAARDYQGTCIVMGTSRKSSLKALFSRSCSNRVAEDSKVPVICIGQQ